MTLDERVRHLELLILFMQSEISTLRNLVKRNQDPADEEFLRQFTEQHQQQFRELFANLPDREAVIQQILADYSGRIQLELDQNEDVP
ncbi:MAG: hypothetical protein ACPGVU_07895 [Limisphaerales bacterium]